LHYHLAYWFIAVMVAVLAPAAAVIWVTADAAAIRRLELHTCGESDCHPCRWGFAVFFLPIVAIPLYVRFHHARTAYLNSLPAPTSFASD
jgi:hypothetical protein